MYFKFSGLKVVWWGAVHVVLCGEVVSHVLGFANLAK